MKKLKLSVETGQVQIAPLEAANLLGWSRNTLTRKIQELMPGEAGE